MDPLRFHVDGDRWHYLGFSDDGDLHVEALTSRSEHEAFTLTFTEARALSHWLGRYLVNHQCGHPVYWWDGEHQGLCQLASGHSGDHFDGTSWFDAAGQPAEAPEAQ